MRLACVSKRKLKRPRSIFMGIILAFLTVWLVRHLEDSRSGEEILPHEVRINISKSKVLPSNYIKKSNNSCYEYNKSAAIKRHVLYDVTKPRRSSAIEWHDVTMVTQMSEDRLDRLHLIMKYWEGPISVSVYIMKKKMKTFLNKLQRRENVAVHFVEVQGTFYPINYMRNVALNTTSTRFVFLNDIDFIPSPGSYASLLDHTKALQSHQVFVVPAFEELSNVTTLRDAFPQDKADLLRLWKEGKVQPFHLKVFEDGQKPTNFTKWRKAHIPYEVNWSRWYEPYIIGYKEDIPQYNENLVGRYENKALLIAEMKAKGFKFNVLPDIFLLHLWHPIIPFNKQIYNCSIAISWPYTRYLEKKYKVSLM